MHFNSSVFKLYWVDFLSYTFGVRGLRERSSIISAKIIITENWMRVVNYTNQA